MLINILTITYTRLLKTVFVCYLYRICMLPTSGDMHSNLFVIVINISDSQTTAQAHLSDNTMSAYGTSRPCENDIKIENLYRLDVPFTFIMF